MYSVQQKSVHSRADGHRHLTLMFRLVPLGYRFNNSLHYRNIASVGRASGLTEKKWTYTRHTFRLLFPSTDLRLQKHCERAPLLNTSPSSCFVGIDGPKEGDVALRLRLVLYGGAGAPGTTRY